MNTSHRLRKTLLLAAAAFLALASSASFADRIKDIASVGGVRINQLVGYGLVVGLDGTGDRVQQAPFTQQSLRNMLINLGVTLPEGANNNVNNIAAVVVTADLPPFSRPGQTIDVTVSSIANAESLRGGTLVMTPLKGTDGDIYAVAQGNLVVGGFGAQGSDGSSITVNVPSVGRIPDGATVERAVASGMAADGLVHLHLHEPDFTTASRIVTAVNASYGRPLASASDAGTVTIDPGLQGSDLIAFMSSLEGIDIEPGMAPAKVIVSSRTGTVIIGSEVRVLPAAVSHGSLVVRIRETQGVSQPGAFAQGETQRLNQSDIEITEEGNRMFVFEPGVTLDSLVEAVNSVGAAPGDLVAILQALKRARALRAELEVI